MEQDTMTLPESFSIRTKDKSSLYKTVDAHSKRRENSTNFFDLPSEVRRLIFKDLLIVDALSIQCDPNKWGIHPQILLTCRTAYEEGKNILRSSNCFLNIRTAGPKQETFAIKNLGRPRYHRPGSLRCESPSVSARITVILGGKPRRFIDQPGNDLLITSAHLFKLTTQLTTYKSNSEEYIALEIDLIFTSPLSPQIHSQIMDSLSRARGLDDVALQVNSSALPGKYKNVALKMKGTPSIWFVDDRMAQHSEWEKLGGHSELSENTIACDQDQLYMMQLFDFLDMVVDFIARSEADFRRRYPSHERWGELQRLKVQCIHLIACWRDLAGDPDTVISCILRFKRPGFLYTERHGQIVNPLPRDSEVRSDLYYLLGAAYKKRGQYDFALHAWYELWMVEPEYSGIVRDIKRLKELVKTKFAAGSKVLAPEDPVIRCSKMFKPIRMIMTYGGYELENRTRAEENAVRLFVKRSIGDIYGWEHFDELGDRYTIVLEPRPGVTRSDPVSAA